MLNELFSIPYYLAYAGLVILGIFFSATPPSAS